MWVCALSDNGQGPQGTWRKGTSCGAANATRGWLACQQVVDGSGRIEDGIQQARSEASNHTTRTFITPLGASLLELTVEQM